MKKVFWSSDQEQNRRENELNRKRILKNERNAWLILVSLFVFFCLFGYFLSVHGCKTGELGERRVLNVQTELPPVVKNGCTYLQVDFHKVNARLQLLMKTTPVEKTHSVIWHPTFRIKASYTALVSCVLVAVVYRSWCSLVHICALDSSQFRTERRRSPASLSTLLPNDMD